MHDRYKRAAIWGVIIVLGVVLGLTAGNVIGATDSGPSPPPPPAPALPDDTPHVERIVYEHEGVVCFREQPSGELVNCQTLTPREPDYPPVVPFTFTPTFTNT